MKIALLEPLSVPESLIEELAQPLIDAGHEFTYYDEKTTDVDELARRSKGQDIVMIANNPYPAEAFADSEDLKLINVAFTGFDHVDVDTAKEKSIKVSNAAGYSDDSVAELVIGLTIDLLRQITVGDHEIRKAEKFSKPFQGSLIKGKTVGIIGTGNIGQQTARLFHAFGADLIGFNRSEKEEMKELGMEYVEWDELFERADIISVHLPNNPETSGIIGAEEFSKMKDSAVFINAARGPILDNDALAAALNNGKLAGAGLDVFDMEPPIPNDYALLSAENTVLTPHVAFLTDEAMVIRAHIAFENTQAFIDGNAQNIVVE